MSDELKCRDCGRPIPDGGLCPHCLLGLGLEAAEDATEDGGRKTEDSGQRTEAGGQKTGPEAPCGKPSDAPQPPAAASVTIKMDSNLETPPAPVSEQPGDRIGRYKLLQRLGEGGMGNVWMAEQTEPVHRMVALKVIKPGMDSAQVLARFEAERQALALMDHPNIARVLDAGATPSGRPYFVMDLVKGIPLIKFCDEQRLSVRERLELFIQVCRAIQHAHQKGIIHRDLKPSNVMVALFDGKPVPKVIDFGVAKAMGQRLTERTLFTQLGVLLGTLEYMSPEQAEMNQLDIDTRSDIYSLGVLLYELLTGTTPLTHEKVRQAAFEEILKLIREEEPPKPSTRLSTCGDLLPTVSAQRKLDPEKLPKMVSGELDWIVMKALEKDRDRRYETASGLASDVESYLNDEPVVAGPPTVRYRVKKFVRKHRRAVAVAGGFLLVATLGFAGITWQWREAIKARGLTERKAIAETAAKAQADKERVRAETKEKLAKTEAAKSQQVARFLEDMLRGVSPSVALGRDTTLLREILDTTAKRIAKDLKDQPEVEADLRQTLGATYYELGVYPEAEIMFKEALRLREKVFGPEHRLVSESLGDLSLLLGQRGDLTSAEALRRRALAIARKLPNEDLLLLYQLHGLAGLRSACGNLPEAEELLREAQPMAKTLLVEGHLEALLSVKDYMTVLQRRGKYDELRSFLPEYLRLIGDLPQSNSLSHEWEQFTDATTNLVSLLQTMLAQPGQVTGAQADGAMAQMEKTMLALPAMLRKLPGYESPFMADYMDFFAVTFCQTDHHFHLAETMLRDALRIREKVLGSKHPGVVRSRVSLGCVLGQQRKWPEAEMRFRQALDIQTNNPGGTNVNLGGLLHVLGSTLSEQGKFVEAEAALRQALDIHKKRLGDEHPVVANDLNSLAWMLQKQGKMLLEAEKMSQQALAIQKKFYSNVHSSVANSLDTLAMVLFKQGRLTEAEGLFRQAIDMGRKLRTLAGDEGGLLADMQTHLAALLLKQGKFAEAEAEQRHALLVLPHGDSWHAEAVLREALANFQVVPDSGDGSYVRELITLGLGDVLAQRTFNLLAENDFAEAEPLAREYLAIRDKYKSLSREWRRFNAQSMLGGSLLGLKKYAEAEPLLLSSYEGMKQREDTIPPPARPRLKEAMERLVQLYEVTGRSDKASEWKQRLADFERVPPGNQTQGQVEPSSSGRKE